MKIDLKQLSKAKRDFFKKMAGIFKLGKIDIKKVYKTKIYD